MLFYISGARGEEKPNTPMSENSSFIRTQHTHLFTNFALMLSHGCGVAVTEADLQPAKPQTLALLPWLLTVLRLSAKTEGKQHSTFGSDATNLSFLSCFCQFQVFILEVR